jgi:hypothetical protein
MKKKDLCKTCEHFWNDFPLPCDHYEPHCEIADKKGIKMEDIPYPCMDCPFNSYSKK